MGGKLGMTFFWNFNCFKVIFSFQSKKQTLYRTTKNLNVFCDGFMFRCCILLQFFSKVSEWITRFQRQLVKLISFDSGIFVLRLFIVRCFLVRSGRQVERDRSHFCPFTLYWFELEWTVIQFYCIVWFRESGQRGEAKSEV